MRVPGPPRRSGPAMAVTITLKTLQQQTFKIRMEPDETVRARLEPGMGVTGSEGGMGAGRQRSRREGWRMARSGPGSLLPTCLTFPDLSASLPLMVSRLAPGGWDGAHGPVSGPGSTPGAPARPRV